MIASILETLRVRSPSRMVIFLFERFSDRGPKIALPAGPALEGVQTGQA